MAEHVRPLIAITGPRRGACGPRSCIAAAIRWLGGVPVQLRPGDDVPQQRFQGVVISGGHDVNPVLYADEPQVQPRYDAERDAFESKVICDALVWGVPLLGICRGAQLLNVMLGGNLFQDLKPHRRLTSHRRTLLPLKTLCLEQNSQLAAAMAVQRCKINSLHNQAIDRLGDGLRVSARDLDGIVQGIEDARQPFLMGVQWHPEFILYQAQQRRLFRSLVDAARAYI